MKRLMQYTVALALLMGAGTVLAQDNTDAGTDVTNTATVNYVVNGVQQTATGDAVTFEVDRIVLVSVASTDTGAGAISVSPLSTDQVLTYTVTNDSNATLDFVLSADNATGDGFDATGLAFFVEDGTTAGYQVAEDTATSIDDLPERTGVGTVGIATVYVVGDIPDVADGLLADVVLTAQAWESDGSAVIDTNDLDADDPLVVDTVIDDLDGPGAGDAGADNGAHSAIATFEVGAATITVTKASVVLSDPFNGTDDPKAIPGAEILYCIEVDNTGSSAAENVAIKDPIPANTTYVDNSIKVFTTAVTCGASLVSTGGTAITDDDADDAAEDTANSGISGNSGDSGATVPEATDTVVNTVVDQVSATNGTTTTIFRVTID